MQAGAWRRRAPLNPSHQDRDGNVEFEVTRTLSNLRQHGEISRNVPDAPLREGGSHPELDAGCIELGAEEDATRFVEMCRELRFCEREPKVKS